jgi:hypothetical protein
MAVTGEQVYDQALVLMDEVTDNGEVLANNPTYYKAKTKSILTMLQAELMSQSETPGVITDLTQELALDDRIALLTLPYGLAAQLLLQDDVSSAAFFNARYEELKKKYRSEFEEITDVYDVSGGV